MTEHKTVIVDFRQESTVSPYDQADTLEKLLNDGWWIILSHTNKNAMLFILKEPKYGQLQGGANVK